MYTLYRNLDSDFLSSLCLPEELYMLVAMNCTAYNLVAVTSMIYVSSQPLSYSKVRSVFTASERFQQTIGTILSVARSIPCAYVVLLEEGNLSRYEIQTLRLAGVHEFFFSHSRYASSRAKGYAELDTLLAFTRTFPRDDDLHFQTFSKISGRYTLTNEFCWHCTPINESMYMCTKDRSSCSTRYYRLPFSSYNLFRSNLMKAFMNDDVASGRRGIEQAGLFHGLPVGKGLVRGKKPALGVSGRIAPDGSLVMD